MATKEKSKHHNMLKGVGVVCLILVIGASYLGFSNARYIREVVKAQFNDQQLVLARATAKRIEGHIQNAISDMVLLNSLPAVQYCDPESYELLLLSTLPVLSRDYIIEIRRVDRDGNTLFAANDQGIAMRHFGLNQSEAGAFLSWALDAGNRGKTMGTDVRSKDPAKERRKLVLDLITPTYEDTTDALHPRVSQRMAGYLRVTLDVSRMLHDTVSPLRSGRTGYSWVIDSAGTFLFHPEETFVGENAFEARSNRNPAISFARINEIQRDEMLRGKEGTGLYVSGWHRDVVEPMSKLIAFSPVSIKGPYVDYTWSVAVVAPVDEIESVVYSVYGRQILLQGLVVLVILLGAATLVLYELRWSTLLQHEVAVKTNDIRRYADELEQSESKYRSLVESAEDLIFTVDLNGVVGTANQHMARLFGAEETGLAERSLYDLLPKDQAYRQVRLIRDAVQSGKRQSIETVFEIRENASWFNIQYIPVKSEGGGRVQVLGIGRDISERKAFERQLINTEKLASLGTLAAGVAHEINNPLGIMLGFCDLLLEKVDPGTMEYNDLKTIERHGLHCKSIVERLLSFARMSEDVEETCDVNENVEAILAVVRHTLTMNNIALACDLSEGLPAVNGNSRGLQQVLLNLISNAVQAMEKDGTLSISSRVMEEEDWVEIKVSDTGAGVRKEILHKIFDPFFTTKKVGEGTGLGLSVSYGIITNFGGTIQCESVSDRDNPGHSGTTFTVMLPAKGSPRALESAAAAETNSELQAQMAQDL